MARKAKKRRNQWKMRLAVARDVIKQLKVEAFEATKGLYVGTEFGVNIETGRELQSQIKKQVTPDQPCQVCAMGACFLSTVRLYNDFKVTRGNISSYGEFDVYALKRKVRQIFGKREMSVIESCFELSPHWLKFKEDRTLFGLGHEFGNAGQPVFRKVMAEAEPNNRLTLLMEIVIANPRREVTVQVVKDTILQFFIEGRYPDLRAELGL